MNRTANMRSAKTRTGLLATVSSIALLGYVCTAADAALASGSDDRPLIWIEIGGQAERTDTAPELFEPPFFKLAVPMVFSALTQSQKFPPYSTGLNGQISFQPENSDWVISAAIRYGRSHSTRHLHHQTKGFPSAFETFQGRIFGTPPFAAYGDTHSSVREAHTVLDFQAGKDIGLGLFGEHGVSTISGGIRFAQFTANSHVTMHALPTYHTYVRLNIPGRFLVIFGVRDSFTAAMDASRNTRAAGPSLSWNASLPVIGGNSDASVNIDWGINAAVLFGRQRAHVSHQTQSCYAKGVWASTYCQHGYNNPLADHKRSRIASIPNLGGFAGISFRYSDAKVSLGYRADMFFGAVDGGIDAAKKEDRAFYGPFASISVGMGD
ncbi:MAG TPA: hypothetical protein VGT78_02875 [Rhizomicrobium sp.]|nr:hypothetical protein [Rhizomicrobium sp.]